MRTTDIGGKTQMQLLFGRLGRLAAIVAIALLALIILGGGSASAATGPVFEAFTTWGDTNLQPGGEGQIVVHLHNVGDEDEHGILDLSVEAPEGTTIEGVNWDPNFSNLVEEALAAGWCEIESDRIFRCELPAEVAESVWLQAPGPYSEGLVFPAYQTGWTAPIYLNVAVSPSASGVGTASLKVEGGGAPMPLEESVQIPFGSTEPPFGVATFMADVFDKAAPVGQPVRQAGAHPFEQRVNFEFTKRSGISPDDGTRYTVANGTIKTVEVTLPRGMISNPEALPKCTPERFSSEGAAGGGTGCPANTQVGYLNIHATAGIDNYARASVFFPKPDAFLSRVAIYNLKPPKGVPADFAFNAGGLVQGHIYPELDPAQNYAIRTVSPEISSLVQPTGAEVVFWGVPGDPVHDKLRYYGEQKQPGERALGAPFEGAQIRPFFTNPMDCGFDNGGARIRVESYQQPGVFSPVQEYSNPLNVTGCDDQRIRFKPQVAIQPDNRDAGGPTGLDVHLEVPQRNDEAKEAKELYDESGEAIAIASPPMKRVVTTFPEGMTLSPSAAQGLGTCTAAQIGLGTNSPVTCPDNSQYGRLILHTPILPATAQPEGFIYIAKQGDNPFHNFLSMYMVIQEPQRGILIKIPARIDLDPNTGQIVATFDELPQFPVSDMELRFKGGVRAGLVNPTTCGQKTIRAEFFSWADPITPHVVDSNYQVTNKPDGSPCVQNLAQRPFKPTLEAGTQSPSAGSYSPFAFRTTRTDDDQEYSQIGVKLPQGFAAKFAGVGICSDAGIAQALSRETVAGAGATEEADPSCPANSEIGTTEVGTGVGVPLSWVPGKVYLAGPYKGAPMSMVVISPAKVGPYDLGVITVRTALNIDPETAQGEATSDPFPQIFQGIPVRIRDIRLNLDRRDFTLNPTSCAPKQITAQITGTGGNLLSTADDTGVNLADRFQAADCASLGFKPKLAFHLFGGVKRGAHPKFQAVLKARPGDANIAATSVALPHSEFLDQAHIKTVCTRVQFAAKACPQGSIYGYAVAKTPLFDKPLSGPVYLRSSSHQLPDLAVALKGPETQPVEVVLDGRIDSVNGGIRNTFEFVPDAPVSEFTLTMQGGKKGLLQNSTNLCGATHRATAKFTGQNGKPLTIHPKMQNACAKARKRHKKH
jgi:hypothetical protein